MVLTANKESKKVTYGKNGNHQCDDYDMFSNSAYYIFVTDKDNVNYITC